MNDADWIAIVAVIVPTLGFMGGVGVKMVIGMTRVVDSVERLTGSVEKIAGTVEDHEKRLTKGGL